MEMLGNYWIYWEVFSKDSHDPWRINSLKSGIIFFGSSFSALLHHLLDPFINKNKKKTDTLRLLFSNLFEVSERSIIFVL